MVAAEVSSSLSLAGARGRAQGARHPRPGRSGAAALQDAAGKVLAGFGVHREPLGARMVRDSTLIPGSGVSVESSARMWLDGVPVALASERVTTEFCQQARTRLASTRAAAIPGLRAS